MVAQTDFHEGRWLRDRVARTGSSQKEFAGRHNFKLNTLVQWFTQPTLKIRPHLRMRLATALGESDDAFNASLLRARVEQMKRIPGVVEKWAEQERSARDAGGASVERMLAHGLPIGDPPLRMEDLPSGIETGSVHRQHEIPFFDLSVAAGEWVDVADVADVCSSEQIDQGLFRVRISGDSMLPKYKNGAIVEFECVRVGFHVLEVGLDYYVQRADGMATFKRLSKIGENDLTLKAINRKKYPKPFTVPWYDITRMAVKRWILTE